MHINSLTLKNYRCYEHLNVEFNPEYCVLAGVNGAGKSTILDGVATALGSFLAGFDGVASNAISPDDAHRKMYELGSRIDAEAQYPVEISASGRAEGEEIKWTRSLHGKNGRTYISGARQIMDYGSRLQEKVRQGDKDTILPLVAYYGTGRSYMSGKVKRTVSPDVRFSRTSGYIDCLSSTLRDKLLLKWFEQMTLIQLQEGTRVPELEAVKEAMGRCFAGIENPEDTAKFEYKIKTQEIEILYQRNGRKEKLPMRLLSDGVRNTIGMIADIAYRMALLNPQLLEAVLEETPGIVLIDEVDMHLHPEWQKRIMEDLHGIFPKIQFIVTTHAPGVLVNVKREHILLLENQQIFMPESSDGL